MPEMRDIQKAAPWRVDPMLSVIVYESDPGGGESIRPICMCQTAADAKRIVEAVNRHTDSFLEIFELAERWRGAGIRDGATLWEGGLERIGDLALKYAGVQRPEKGNSPGTVFRRRVNDAPDGDVEGMKRVGSDLLRPR